MGGGGCVCVGGKGLWRQGGAGGGGRAVEQMQAELRTSFTQRHSPIGASVTTWSRKGEGRKTETTLKIKPS